MTLFDQIERLTQDKEAIRTSLNEKGCNIGEEVSLDDYANIITNSDLGSGSSELLLKDYPITYELDGETFLVKDKEALKQYTYQYYRIHYKDLVLNTLENDLILTEDYNDNILITENSLFEHNTDEKTIKYNGKTFVCVDDILDLNEVKFDSFIIYNYRKKDESYNGLMGQAYERPEKYIGSFFICNYQHTPYNDITTPYYSIDSKYYSGSPIKDINENGEYYALFLLNTKYYYMFKNGIPASHWPNSYYIHITD